MSIGNLPQTRRIKKCDTPLNGPQQALAKSYLPLARTAIKRFSSLAPYNQEEVESQALFTLVNCVRDFDPKRNVKFASYYYWRLSKTMLDLCRKEYQHGWRGAPNGLTPHHLQPIMHEAIPALLDDSADSMMAEVETEDYEGWLLRAVPAEYREVLWLHLICKWSQKMISEKIGLSKSRISYIIKDMKTYLVDRYMKHEIEV